jgi:mannose-1-phosphate guanylyltransferase/mannose-6-phosphate isomerase
MRHAVILAGGSGERFWPVSRDDRPKPFLALDGSTSLLRATFERLRGLVPAERVWVVAAERHAPRVRRELPEIPRGHVLGEPRGLNTAPALHLAALAILREDPEGVLLALPADAWVPRIAPFARALRSALSAAEAEDRLVLVGVKPVRAETGYGYIEPGERLGRGPARHVLRFVEKPSAARAKRFLREGRHLWNAGIFAWRAGVYGEAVARHLPGLAAAFRGLEGRRPTGAGLAAAYAAAPTISVDYGILQHSDRVAVVPADFAWDDLGAWSALARLDPAFRKGDVFAWDSPGLLAWAEGGRVAVIGVPDVVVVHTPEATLVVARDRAQDVRRVAEALRGEVRKNRLKEG